MEHEISLGHLAQAVETYQDARRALNESDCYYDECMGLRDRVDTAADAVYTLIERYIDGRVERRLRDLGLLRDTADV